MTLSPPSTTDTLAPRLDGLLKSVNDWLKFAETKNVGIVGLASGGLSVLLVAVGFLTDDDILHPLAGMLLLTGGAALAISLLVGVWSFLPATSMPHWMRLPSEPPRPDDNLFYFGHLSRYDPASLVAAIAERYERAPDLPVTALHTDLAAQIVVNARITMQKLRLFRWSVVLFGAGVLIGTAGILLDLRGP
jgi:hypothetical protein